MPPKRVASAKKKLTKKELEEQQAELEAAQAAAALLRSQREAAALAEAEEKRRAEEELVVRDPIEVENHSHADIRSVLLRSFGHLYPPPPPPPQPVAAPATATAEETAASTPTSSRPNTGSKKKVSTGKKSPSTASPGPSSRATGAATGSSSKSSPASTAKKPLSSGKKKTASEIAKETAEAAAAAERERKKAEDDASASAAAAAALQAEQDKNKPKFSPETEAQLAHLKSLVEQKNQYTNKVETMLLEHQAQQRELDAAEGNRLVRDFRLIPQVDMPDEQRRQKEHSVMVPKEPQELINPSSASLLSASGSSDPSLARTMPSKTDHQVLSSSGLIDLQAILDRQKARQEKVNRRIDYEDPSSATGEIKHKKKESRKALLDTGMAPPTRKAKKPNQQGSDDEDANWDDLENYGSSSKIPSRPKTMMFSEIKANQAILAHMKTLSEYPKNPRYDPRNDFSGGPGGKGLMVRKDDTRDTTVPAITAELARLLPQLSDSSALDATLSQLQDEESTKSCLVAHPPILWFTQEWSSGDHLEAEVEVKNIGTLSRRIRVEGPPPAPGYFATDHPRYPGKSETALLAPGMSCFVKVHFKPDALCDFSSVFRVVTETGRIVVPLYAARPKPVLDLSATVEVGVCAWNDAITRSLTVRNIGESHGRFWFMSRERFEQFERKQTVAQRSITSPRHRPILTQPKFQSLDATPLFTSKALTDYLSLMSEEDLEDYFTELDLGEGTFKISPAFVDLHPGQAQEIMVEYNPHISEHEHRLHEAQPYLLQHLLESFLVVCNNTTVSTHDLSGKTCDVHLELIAVDGLDLEAKKNTVQADALRRRALAAQSFSRVQTSRANTARGGERRASHGPQPVLPINPPPNPDVFENIGPANPKFEHEREQQLLKTLKMEHPLPNYEDEKIPVHKVAGMLTPRGSARGEGDENARGHTGASILHVEDDNSAPSHFIRSFSELVFPTSEISSTVTKTVTLKNLSALPVQYNWKFNDPGAMFHHTSPKNTNKSSGTASENERADVATGDAFTVMPSFGRFEPHTTQTFTFTFTPTTPIHYQRTCKFVIEDVPESTGVIQHSAPTNDGNLDTFQRTLSRAKKAYSNLIDLEYFSLNLSGFGAGIQLELSPTPLVVFEKPLPLNGQLVRKVVKLSNKSSLKTAPAVPFQFETPLVSFQRTIGISDELDLGHAATLTPDAESSSALEGLQITPSSGELASGESIEVAVEFIPRLLGKFSVQLGCTLPALLASTSSTCAPSEPSSSTTPSLTTSMSFQTCGPTLRIEEPSILDFGLLNKGIPNVCEKRTLIFKNLSSSVPAKWCLVEKGQTPLNFLGADGQSSKGISEEEQNAGEGLLSFNPPRGILQPNCIQSVEVTYTPVDLSPLRSSVSLHYFQSALPYVQRIETRAHVQAPILTVLPCVIEMDRSVFRQVNDEEEEAKRLAALETARLAKEAEEKRIADEIAAAAAEKARRMAEEAKALVEASLKAEADRKEAEAKAAAEAKARKRMTPAQIKKEKEKAEKAAAAAAAEAAAASLAASVSATPREGTPAASTSGEQKGLEEEQKDEEKQALEQKEEEPKPLSAYLKPVEDLPLPNPSIQKQNSVLCVRVPRTFEVTLKNLTNLPAAYRWTVVGEGSEGGEEVAPAAVSDTARSHHARTDSQLSSRSASGGAPYEVHFTPVAGMLQGREEKTVHITVTMYRSGPVHLLFACDIEGVAKPLAVEIKANVRDLTLSYHSLTPVDALTMQEELQASGFQVSGTASSRSLHSRTSSFGGGSSDRSHRRGQSTARSDYSSAEGLARIEARNAIMDKYIPAKQVHSKITVEASRDEPLINPDADEENLEQEIRTTESTKEEEEKQAAEEEKKQQKQVLGRDIIVPTAAGLPKLNYGVCRPGTRKALSFILRNHTMIPARFTAKVCKYAPMQPREIVDKNITSPIARALLEKKKNAAAGSAIEAAKLLSQTKATIVLDSTAKSLSSTTALPRSGGTTTSILKKSSTSSLGKTSDISGKTGVTAEKASKRPTKALSSDYESANRFQSDNGQAVTAENALKHATLSVIPPEQGIAFSLSASQGVLGAFSTYRLDVTVLSDACGIFDDELLVTVKGLGSVRIPLHAAVSGLPLEFSAKNLGILFPDSPAAARNKVVENQKKKIGPVLDVVGEGEEKKSNEEETTSTEAAAAAATTKSEVDFARRENEAILAAHASFVQHGFDVYPKLFFRPMLVHIDEESKKMATHAVNGTVAESGPSSFDRRLTYNTNASGGMSDRSYLVTADQIRTVLLENNGPTDIKIRWRQYDLRSIQHHQLVDVSIQPSPRGIIKKHAIAEEDKEREDEESKENGQESRPDTAEERLVELDVSRYVYPSESQQGEMQATARSARTARSDVSSTLISGGDGEGSLTGRSTSRSLRSSNGEAGFGEEAEIVFPFILDPPELVIPARGTASFRVIYDPTRMKHPVHSVESGEATHDINFIDAQIFIPQAAPGTAAAASAAAAAAADQKGDSDSASTQQSTARSTKNLRKVLNDIDAFEARADAQLEALSDEEAEYEDNLATTLQATSLNNTTKPIVGSTSSLLRANRIAKYFAPKPLVTWVPAPAELSSHEFRLVLSARSVVPQLTVDKKRGKLKFVCQIPRPDTAPASTTSTSTADKLAATTVLRPNTASLAGGTVTNRTTTAAPVTKSLRSQLSLVKLLPLTNQTGATLHFRVVLSPSSRFSLEIPPKTKEAPPKRPVYNTREPPAKPTPTLPLSGTLGWKSSNVEGCDFTLAPGENLVLPIRFLAPSPNNQELWPVLPQSAVEGEVRIQFENGSVQTVPVEALLLRPYIHLSQTTHDFGLVHTIDTIASLGAGMTMGNEIDEFFHGNNEVSASATSVDFQSKRSKQLLELLLTNPSLVDAHWSMEHVPRMQRIKDLRVARGELSESMHPKALRNLSNHEFDDDADALDDPSVFVFQSQTGVVPAGAGLLHEHAAALPSGLVTAEGLTTSVHEATFGRNITGTLSDNTTTLRGGSKPEVVARVPVSVGVVFRPRLKSRYKSIFRFKCLHGADMGETIEVALEGTGAYEENIPNP